MRYDEVRRLLELIEILDWFEEQGYGDRSVWAAVRVVQSVALDAAQSDLENTIISAVKA